MHAGDGLRYSFGGGGCNRQIAAKLNVARYAGAGEHLPNGFSVLMNDAELGGQPLRIEQHFHNVSSFKQLKTFTVDLCSVFR